MCGIIGYVGHQQAAPILLEGLSRMEYRGYDSAAWRCGPGKRACRFISPRGGFRCCRT